MLKVTWKQVEEQCEKLAQRIEKFQMPEYIYGVPRGGLVPAIILSHRLGVPLIAEEDEADRLSYEGHLLLVVDDINDTGHTLSNFKAWHSTQTIVLYERAGSSVRADWAGEYIEHNGWIIMPWEQVDNATEDMIEYLERRHGKVGV